MSVALIWSSSISAVPRCRGFRARGSSTSSIATTPDDVPAVAAMLRELGFGPQPGPDPWPPGRPMLVGSIVRAGTTFRIHCHVLPEQEELRRDIAFRDALLADPALVEGYAALKTGIVTSGPLEPHQYTYRKQAWISDVHRKLGRGAPADRAASHDRHPRGRAARAHARAWRPGRWAIASSSSIRTRTVLPRASRTGMVVSTLRRRRRGPPTRRAGAMS